MLLTTRSTGTLSLKKKACLLALVTDCFNPERPVIHLKRANGDVLVMNITGVTTAEIRQGLLQSKALLDVVGRYGEPIAVSTRAEDWLHEPCTLGDVQEWRQHRFTAHHNGERRLFVLTPVK